MFACLTCRRMIEEGSKRGKALVEKRQLFMEMSECERSAHARFSLELSAAAAAMVALCRRRSSHSSVGEGV